MVLAAEVNERLAGMHNQVFYFRDEDRVVAGIPRILQAAFEIRQGPMQHRGAVRSAIELGLAAGLHGDRLTIRIGIMHGNR